MNPDLMKAITALAGRFVAQALIDEGLREDLRTLAGAILVATERPPSMTPVGPVPQFVGDEGRCLPGPDCPPAVELDATTAMPEPARTAPPLTFGNLSTSCIKRRWSGSSGISARSRMDGARPPSCSNRASSRCSTSTCWFPLLIAVDCAWRRASCDFSVNRLKSINFYSLKKNVAHECD